MLKRYPHNAVIRYTTTTDDGTGIPTETTVEIPINDGRYDPGAGNKNLDYKAKFYCPTLSVNRFSLDGAVLVFAGKEFSIANLFEYQNHTEIWLE